MMRMRVGLHHVLNDPVGFIYTPVIFSLYVFYTILVAAPYAHQLLEYYYTCNDDLQPFLNCQYLTATVKLYRDIVVLSRSLRKQDILAQVIVRKQDNDG